MKQFYILSLGLLCSLSLAAQSVRVSGTVLDAANSDALIGVSVLEDGTTNGIVTDLDGNFVLEVEIGHDLNLSYVGYAPLTIKVKKAGDLGIIKMESEAVTLEDVTITASMAVARKTPVAASFGARDRRPYR